MEKTEDKGLRCYFMNIFYFAGIHAGIQAQHASTRLLRKYAGVHKSREETEKEMMVYDWADNHETSIVVNAGMHGDLVLLEQFLESEDNPFPWARFNESEYAANGCYTSIAIVLPEDFYGVEPMSFDKDGNIVGASWTPWELEFKQKLGRMPLFR